MLARAGSEDSRGVPAKYAVRLGQTGLVPDAQGLFLTRCFE